MKLVLDDINNLEDESTVVGTLNSNADAVEEALENTLSRDGTSPNEMASDLDMNSHRILNVPTPSYSTDVVRKIDLDNAILGGYVVTPFNPLSANLNAAGFKITGLGAPSANADAVRLIDLTTAVAAAGSITLPLAVASGGTGATTAAAARTALSVPATTRAITAGLGLSGGGDLSADRAFAFAPSGLTEDTTPDSTNDFVVTYDTSAALPKKVKISNIAITVNTAARADDKVLYYDSSSGTHKYAYATPKNAEANLWDFLDARHGTGVWTQFSGTTSGTDIALAVGDACDALRSRYGRGTLKIPPGAYLSTSWDASKVSGHTITGLASSLGCQLMFNIASGYGIQVNGYQGYAGGGISHLNLNVTANNGNTNAYALGLTEVFDAALYAASGNTGGYYAASNTFFDDLYIQGLGSAAWKRGINIEAPNKVAPQANGVRIGEIRNVQMFCSHPTGIAFYALNAVHWNFVSIQSYGSVGTDFYIDGGGAGNNSTQIHMSAMLCSGDLNLGQCDNLQIFGKANSATFHTTVTSSAGLVKVNSTAGTLGTGCTNFITY